MKNLHNILIGDIPDIVKYIAIGWTASGYDKIYPLFYNPRTNKLMYTYMQEPRREFQDYIEDTLYAPSGKRKGLAAYRSDMVTICNDEPSKEQYF